MAEVIYTRKETDAELNNVEVTDGQIMYTKQGHVYMDFGNDRISMQNTPDVQMSDVSTNTVDNRTIKSYVDNRVQTIKDETDKEKLWTNPLPSSDFAGQEITLSKDLSNFGGYEILYAQSKSTSRIMTTGIIPIGHGTIFGYTTGNKPYRATSTTVSGTTITFEDGYETQNGTSLINNDLVIPIMVIGHKTTIFN